MLTTQLTYHIPFGSFWIDESIYVRMHSSWYLTITKHQKRTWNRFEWNKCEEWRGLVVFKMNNVYHLFLCCCIILKFSLSNQIWKRVKQVCLFVHKKLSKYMFIQERNENFFNLVLSILHSLLLVSEWEYPRMKMNFYANLIAFLLLSIISESLDSREK